ncbi:hypothetical protein F5Y19DRAFT_413298 [Xylariaceae sp. FL1651]|nr:hypothetical protein F5Y19DRAFT_413298 [Xylariaceae sp. FL1651]
MLFCELFAHPRCARARSIIWRRINCRLIGVRNTGLPRWSNLNPLQSLILGSVFFQPRTLGYYVQLYIQHFHPEIRANFPSDASENHTSPGDSPAPAASTPQDTNDLFFSPTKEAAGPRHREVSETYVHPTHGQLQRPVRIRAAAQLGTQQSGWATEHQDDDDDNDNNGPASVQVWTETDTHQNTTHEAQVQVLLREMNRLSLFAPRPTRDLGLHHRRALEDITNRVHLRENRDRGDQTRNQNRGEHVDGDESHNKENQKPSKVPMSINEAIAPPRTDAPSRSLRAPVTTISPATMVVDRLTVPMFTHTRRNLAVTTTDLINARLRAMSLRR